MILRARPKFLIEDFFNFQSYGAKSDRMYFNYGRTALAFLLQVYAEYRDKKLKVGIQSFNCEVIAWAVLSTGNDLHLLDIKREDFSLSLDRIQECSVDLDVIVLTHYQGIPNLEYDQIVKYCSVHNILLIDDVAQTENSYYKGELVGTLADFSIHSFSFDKPFTTWTGGELRVQKCQNTIFIKLLEKKYPLLKVEKTKKESLDIKLLHFLWLYSDVSKFHIKLNNRYLLRFLIGLHIPFKLLYEIISCLPGKIVNVLNRIVFKFQGSEIQIERMGLRKIMLLEKQIGRSSGGGEYQIPEIISRGEDLFHKGDRFINWNRYSFLDESEERKKVLSEHDMDVGNYNWPEPLDIKFKDDPHVFLHGNYEITHYVARNILNVPIWPYFKIYGE